MFVLEKGLSKYALRKSGFVGIVRIERFAQRHPRKHLVRTLVARPAEIGCRTVGHVRNLVDFFPGPPAHVTGVQLIGSGAKRPPKWIAKAGGQDAGGVGIQRLGGVERVGRHAIAGGGVDANNRAIKARAIGIRLSVLATHAAAFRVWRTVVVRGGADGVFAWVERHASLAEVGKREAGAIAGRRVQISIGPEI